LLAIERSNEEAARNRDVLMRALEEMHRQRLLGKGQKDLEASALVSEGGLRKKGPVEGSEALTVRYAAPLVELYATFEADHAIESVLLVFTDPARAAAEEDDKFKVTVVSKEGQRQPVNFATAASITFLREALGCPMTHAGEIYARVLAGEPAVEWGGAIV